MITVASPDEFVSDGGVVYSENGFPLIFIGVVVITPFNYTLPSSTYGYRPRRHLRLLHFRRWQAGDDDLHGQGLDRLRAAAHAAIRSRRRRLSRRGGQGPDQRRSRRHLLAAGHPAHRSHQPLERLRDDAGRGARPGADRDVRPARRLDHHRARDLRRVHHRAGRRAIDPAARALRARQVHLEARRGNSACSTRWTW